MTLTKSIILFVYCKNNSEFNSILSLFPEDTFLVDIAISCR